MLTHPRHLLLRRTLLYPWVTPPAHAGERAIARIARALAGAKKGTKFRYTPTGLSCRRSARVVRWKCPPTLDRPPTRRG